VDTSLVIPPDDYGVSRCTPVYGAVPRFLVADNSIKIIVTACRGSGAGGGLLALDAQYFVCLPSQLMGSAVPSLPYRNDYIMFN